MAGVDKRNNNNRNEEAGANKGDSATTTSTAAGSTSSGLNDLTAADWETLTLLNHEYKRVMEENQISMIAKFESIRQTARGAIALMTIVITLGTTFVRRRAKVSVSQAILFSVYTITSAGFGNVVIPHTSGFLLFVMAYLFVGISLLAILFAQVFQYLELEAGRFQHVNDKAENAVRGLRRLELLVRTDSPDSLDYNIRSELIATLREVPQPRSTVTVRRCDPKTILSFIRYNRCASVLLVPFILILLLFMGTITMVHLEGWTPVQALYFSTFAMTTVGYGDLSPTTNASTWFVDCWLPFNVIFIALYLGLVAHYYVKVSNWNVRRIEKNLVQQEEDSKNKVIVIKMYPRRSREVISGAHSTGSIHEVESVEESDIENSKSLPVQEDDRARKEETDTEEEEGVPQEFDLAALFKQQPKKRGERARQMSKLTLGDDANSGGEIVSVDSTRDLLRFLGVYEADSEADAGNPAVITPANTERERFELNLRFRVLDRLVRIIASHLYNVETKIEIKGNNLLVTVESLKEAADSWLIPHRAREAFRAVYFSGIINVGEHEIATRGAEAFLDLNPFDFSDLFCPFVAAFEDLETMAGWLASTEALAKIRLSQEGNKLPTEKEQSMGLRRLNRAMENKIEGYFPVNPGNAVLIQM